MKHIQTFIQGASVLLVFAYGFSLLALHTYSNLAKVLP